MTARCHGARQRLQAALAACPSVTVGDRQLGDHLTERGIDDDAVLGLSERGTLDDVVLTAACLLGDTSALRALDESLERATKECAARMGLSDTDRSEVAQLLRTRLLVASSKPGALHTYDGRGPLLAWLRVCASRQALLLGRRAGAAKEVPLDSAAACEPFFDPELRVLVTEGRDEVKRAFQAAFDHLADGQKTLLAYHYLDRLPLREIGRVLRVDPSTVSRRLSDVRSALLRGTKAQLLAAKGSTPQGVDSMIEAVRSQLDVSVSRLLRAGRTDA